MSSGASRRLLPEPAFRLGLLLKKQRQTGHDLDPARIAPQPQGIVANVEGGIDVRIGFMPAGNAPERVALGPVVRIDMAAGVAPLTGMSRRHQQQHSTIGSQLLPEPQPRRPHTQIQQRRFRPAFCATFRPGSAAVPWAEAVMLRSFNPSIAMTPWFWASRVVSFSLASLRLRACAALNRARARTAFLLLLLPFFRRDTVLFSLRSRSFPRSVTLGSVRISPMDVATG